MENRPCKVVFITQTKLGEAHKHAMSDLTFDLRVKVKGKGGITWAVIWCNVWTWTPEVVF